MKWEGKYSCPRVSTETVLETLWEGGCWIPSGNILQLLSAGLPSLADIVFKLLSLGFTYRVQRVKPRSLCIWIRCSLLLGIVLICVWSVLHSYNCPSMVHEAAAFREKKIIIKINYLKLSLWPWVRSWLWLLCLALGDEQRSSFRSTFEYLKLYVILQYWFKIGFKPEVEKLLLSGSNQLSFFIFVSSELDNHQYNLR